MGETARITEVIELSDEDKRSCRALRHPILVAFPRAVGPSGSGRPSLQLYEDPERTSNDESKREILVCKADGAEWEGRTGESAYPVTYFAALHSKKTGNVRLIEVDSHFAMRPRLLEAPELDRPETNDEPVTPGKTKYERREDLLEMFGGRRARNRYKAFRRDEIRDGLIKKQYTKDVVEAAVKQHEEDMVDKDVAQDLTTESLAPPHNSQATSAESAYPLDGLMCPHEWHAVKQQAEDLIKGYDRTQHRKAEQQPGWHSVTWKFLLEVLTDGHIDNSTKLTRVMATLYLNILVAIANCRRRIVKPDKQRMMESLGIDEEHLDYLLSKFSETSYSPDGTATQQKSTATDDRLCYYAVVSWLTVEGFVNCGGLGELAHALGVTAKVLAQCAVRVGGKLQKRKSLEQSRDYAAFTVTLRVPLKFPLLNKSNKRRRSRRKGIV